MRQLLRSVSGGNLCFTFPLFHGYGFGKKECEYLNINFERRDLFSAQKSYPFPNDFGEAFAFNVIKQNLTRFSFSFLKQNFCCAPEKFKFKLLLPGTVSFSTSYPWWLIRQRLLISASPSPALPLPLLDMYPHQTAIFKMM